MSDQVDAREASLRGRDIPWRLLGAVGLVAVAAILTLQSLVKLQGVILVVAASLVIALGLQRTIAFMERRGLSRGGAVVTMVGFGALVVIGFLFFALPLVAGQMDSITEQGPRLIDDLRRRNALADAVFSRIDIDALFGGEDGFVSIAGAIFNLVTVGVLTPYFVYSLPKMKLYLLRLIRRDDREEFVRLFNEAVERVSGFVSGNAAISVIATVVSFIALWLLDVPFPAVLAIWIGITDLIPVAGVFLGAIPAIAIAALEVDTGTAVAVGLFIFVYQQIENYLIAPKIMERTVDLSPPAVIISLMVGGSLAGVLGALLALPVAALVSLLFRNFVIDRRIDHVRLDNQANPGAPASGRRKPLP